ncbi:YceD family protein [uncultured Endozoicomonas sp.]|uniref:YceD family protein n=1 Tax=uncultured Endozoicomonas sp. TaxID=432652 RepID=UPI0026396E7E|nr:YceD family protein [uncultured Endozoicomonas sp.]
MLSGQLPKTFDPRKLARQGLQFEGTLALNKFEQLVASLADDQGEVKISLHFYMSEDHRVVLQGHVEANLKLICQRCLDLAELPVRVDLNLMGVLTDEQAKMLPEEFEPLMLQEEPMELIPLLEEELLLSLPIVAYHPPEACQVQQSYTTESDEELRDSDAQAEEERKRRNPFSVLAGLKKDIEPE